MISPAIQYAKFQHLAYRRIGVPAAAGTPIRLTPNTGWHIYWPV